MRRHPFDRDTAGCAVLETERVGQGHDLLALDAPIGALRAGDDAVGLSAEVDELLDARHLLVATKRRQTLLQGREGKRTDAWRASQTNCTR